MQVWYGTVDQIEELYGLEKVSVNMEDGGSEESRAVHANSPAAVEKAQSGEILSLIISHSS